MKIKRIIMLVMVVVVFAGCIGCSSKTENELITLTLWHVYGGQTDSPLNAYIDEFNETVGTAENIRVQVTSVSNTNTIHNNVLASAYGDPGSAELPDMFSSYAKTVLAMPDDSVLVDYKDYFTDAELAEFIPEFLEDGEVNGHLSVLPVGKSTEIMFVNKTGFDRFAAETGAKLSDLGTWEGLYRLAELYYDWTDAKTPDTDNDGKVFFVHDYHFNYFQVGVESLYEDFFADGELSFGPMFEYAWKPYAEAAIKGGVWLQSGYATEPLRTGDSIVSVASSASILYYSDTVTYSDNTSEQIEIISLPCPTFENGEKLVAQRGAGICTVKSTPEREQACITFLKWLTEAERNAELVTKLGYMPVKTESFEIYLPQEIDNLTEPKYRSLYEAYIETQKNYTFYTLPKLDNYLDLETRFEDLVRTKLYTARSAYLKGDLSLEELAQETLQSFKNDYQK